MAKLLIQDGALRYRPGMGLALDDCAECCGNPTCPSCGCCSLVDQMASHPSLPGAGVTFEYDFDSLATNYSNGEIQSWHRQTGSGTVTGSGSCAFGFSASASVEYTNSLGETGTRQLVLSFNSRLNTAAASCYPTSSTLWTRFEASSGPSDSNGGIAFRYYRRPGESWWHTSTTFPNPGVSGCAGVQQAHPNNDSSGSNWAGAASSSGNLVGNAVVGIMGSFNRTRLLSNGLPARSVVATISARVSIPELLPCPGAPLLVAPPTPGCSTCNDNNTGGFTV